MEGIGNLPVNSGIVVRGSLSHCEFVIVIVSGRMSSNNQAQAMILDVPRLGRVQWCITSSWRTRSYPHAFASSQRRARAKWVCNMEIVRDSPTLDIKSMVLLASHAR